MKLVLILILMEHAQREEDYYATEPKATEWS